MIWPDIWVFVLAVVWRKNCNRRWVNRIMSTRENKHLLHENLWCCCQRCVAEFDHFFRWVPISSATLAQTPFDPVDN